LQVDLVHSPERAEVASQIRGLDGEAHAFEPKPYGGCIT
jgi:hypothetical protein